jgi:hypothetical protein
VGYPTGQRRSQLSADPLGGRGSSLTSWRKFAVALILLGPWAVRAEPPTEEQLESLASEVQRSRAAPPTNPPGPKGPTPALGFLTGIAADRLRTAFGEPDSCSFSSGGQCTASGQWQYVLDTGPPGWLGGGGRVLVLEFGAGPACKSASWQFAR